jgi:hypothetical protein
MGSKFALLLAVAAATGLVSVHALAQTITQESTT